MLFTSYTFLFAFLPLVLAGWWGLAALGLRRTRLAFLTTASWVFYAWFDFPVGLQLLGAAGDDVGLLSAALAVETVVGRAPQAELSDSRTVELHDRSNL